MPDNEILETVRKQLEYPSVRRYLRESWIQKLISDILLEEIDNHQDYEYVKSVFNAMPMPERALIFDSEAKSFHRRGLISRELGTNDFDVIGKQEQII
jgi:hypothetical protein